MDPDDHYVPGRATATLMDISDTAIEPASNIALLNVDWQRPEENARTLATSLADELNELRARGTQLAPRDSPVDEEEPDRDPEMRNIRNYQDMHVVAPGEGWYSRKAHQYRLYPLSPCSL
jgi:hypothetical protein